jgi:Tfp pilus assembly protein PilO
MKVTLSPKTFYILSGAVVVVGAGMIWMTNSSISDQSNHIATLRKELRDEKEVQAELADSKKRVEDLKFKLVHLEQGVQDFAYIPTMLKELEQFGKKNNLEIVEVKPIPTPPPTEKEKQSKKEKSAYQELNVHIKARGSYEHSLAFLEAIKIFPKIVAVRTVSLAPHLNSSAIKTAKPVLELELDLRAYAFKEEDQAAKRAPKTASKQHSRGRNES